MGPPEGRRGEGCGGEVGVLRAMGVVSMELRGDVL